MYYSQSSGRLKKITDNLKLAAKKDNYRFIQQSLGHGLYTTIEIEKRKAGRKKRCSLCASAVKTYMDTIKKEIGVATFEKFIGAKDRVTLMFVIDDTGSMSSEIHSAKAIATYIVNHPRPNTEVDFVLSPFNDPSM